MIEREGSNNIGRPNDSVRELASRGLTVAQDGDEAVYPDDDFKCVVNPTGEMGHIPSHSSSLHGVPGEDYHCLAGHNDNGVY